MGSYDFVTSNYW